MLGREQVENIANLARLDLSESEILEMQKDLSAVLDYFNLLKKVKKVKTASFKTKSSGFLEIEKVTRKDIATRQLANATSDLISQAPQIQDGYIKVKAIF